MPYKNREERRAAEKRYRERRKGTPGAERARQTHRKWAKTAKHKAYLMHYMQEHPEIRMFTQAKTRAKKTGLEFTINKYDIVIPEYCPYLKVKLTSLQGEGKLPYNVSLDRIDSSKGYVPGNVQVISNRANTMKNDATISELVEFAKNIIIKHDKKETE